MKNILLFLFSGLWLYSAGQTAPGEPLWPDDPAKPGAELFVYRPQDRTEPVPAVVVCPGGAYLGLAIGYEGHDVARWFADRGMVAVVLKYRMPKGDPAIPLEDAQQAVRTVKARGAQWNVDTARVGVAGFSAGGHLAATLSTLGAPDARPDFAILYYPVIDMMDDAVTHAVSRSCLLGQGEGDLALRERYSLQRQVDSRTPPTVLLLSDDDTGVPPVNSTMYFEALKAQGIPAALYIFPVGEHGWGFQPSFAYHEQMKSLVGSWLVQNGILEKSEKNEAGK